jgi:nicotinate-nucleotide adenylyltransferase
VRQWLRPPGIVADGLSIGLLGGSFNPAHDGHVHASELALKQLRLDRVWWLVSPQNPLKPVAGMASLETRLRSARQLARHPRITVTDLESTLGTRFTVDTLKGLKRRFPLVQFVWLIGSDNLLQMPRWRAWKDIFATVPVAVIARPGSVLAARCGPAATRFRRAYVRANSHLSVMPPPIWTMLDGKRSGASATFLREQASRF